MMKSKLMVRLLATVIGSFFIVNTNASSHCSLTLKSQNRRRISLFAFPDVSASTLVTQGTTGAVTYFGLLAYFDRPRGKLMVDESSVEAKQSQVEGAGLGLYATKNMKGGTILGTYPGVLRPAQKYMLKYEGKPNAGIYAWRFDDNNEFIDPTDREGMLQNECYGGTDDLFLSHFFHKNVWKFPVSTLLARINEPPIGGGGCNVMSEENLETREVLFSLSRDVMEGEELFMDYGLSYDRTMYGPK